MAKKKPPQKEKEEQELNAKRELFCRCYTQNSELFGNATLSYAEAFDYKLDELSHDAVYVDELDPDTGEMIKRLVEDSPHDKAYHVCSVQSSKLLRNAEIQKRIRQLLNELLKDDVVDSELAKLIQQDRDLPTKIRSIGEYNKLRGRITDKSKITISQSFGMDDLRAALSVLPQERQDHVYAIITNALADADSIRGGTANTGGDTQQS